jgi:hypothetical protein
MSTTAAIRTPGTKSKTTNGSTTTRTVSSLGKQATATISNQRALLESNEQSQQTTLVGNTPSGKVGTRTELPIQATTGSPEAAPVKESTQDIFESSGPRTLTPVVTVVLTTITATVTHTM